LAKSLRRGLHRLLIAWRERAQRMLNPVAELPKDDIGNVQRILCDKVNAHALRANQTNHLFDLFQQDLGRVVEQQVRLVEEKGQLRFLRVADFRQPLE